MFSKFAKEPEYNSASQLSWTLIPEKTWVSIKDAVLKKISPAAAAIFMSSIYDTIVQKDKWFVFEFCVNLLKTDLPLSKGSGLLGALYQNIYAGLSCIGWFLPENKRSMAIMENSRVILQRVMSGKD